MKAKEKATVVIRVAVVVVVGAGVIYFLARDWETLRRPADAD
ncbi:hypothetical protein [Corynebacterium sp. HMSC04H06]|nr:hypothetical protein [Corynebacterium sp. HMSC04H06]